MQNSKSYTGITVDRYRFDEKAGEGAVGAVYKAFDQRLLRPVAIKVSAPHAGSGYSSVENILREAQIIARVEHANIVPVYDVLDYDESVLIVMRFLKGQNLEKLLQTRDKPFSVVEALTIMRQVMRGMNFAHSRGVVHADLKPGNIFVSTSKEIYILDFGLAAILELEKPDPRKMYGTPLYMSPEQCNGVYRDARSDIYSLGLILYKLLTGLHPFEHAESMQQLLIFQTEKTPERPDNINPEIPAQLADCILQALQKNPDQRYCSCNDFIEKVLATLENIRTEEDNTRQSRWNPRASLNLQAKIWLQNNNKLIATEIKNLSVSGASIVTSFFPGVGTRLKVEFDILQDSNYITMSSSATVLWENRKANTGLIEAGISFDDMDDMDKQYLAFYIRNLLLA